MADNIGEMYISREELEALTRMAFDHGLQLVSDGIGDRAMRTVLDAFIKIIEDHPDEDLRFGIDHCQITTEGIIEDFARYGIIGGLELIFLASDIAIVRDRVGEHRAAMSYNWKKFKDLSVVIAAGSDSPVEEYSPLHGIYAAVSRCTLRQAAGRRLPPEQKLSVSDALHAFTTGPAYATFEEDKKGTIEEGKYADFVVLDRDLYAIDPLSIMDTEVLMTVVGGEIVYQKIGENMDYILYNGNFISMEGEKARYGAVAVCGDKIVHTYGDRDQFPKRCFGAKMIDLAGRTVLPGFIDSNIHMVQSGLLQYCIKINAETKEEFLQLFKGKGFGVRRQGSWCGASATTKRPSTLTAGIWIRFLPATPSWSAGRSFIKP